MEYLYKQKLYLYMFVLFKTEAKLLAQGKCQITNVIITVIEIKLQNQS
jgi:hypothetical protein